MANSSYNVMDIWNEALDRAARVMQPFMMTQAQEMPWDQVDVGTESNFDMSGMPSDPFLSQLIRTNTQSGQPFLGGVRGANVRQAANPRAVANAPGSANTPAAVAYAAATQVGQPATSDLIAAGSKYLGRPYVWGGGRGTTANFDCSSFVSQAVFDATGKKLTPFTDSIYNETSAVDPRDAKIGDIVLFEWADPNQPGVRFSHTGIYAGNGQILNATSPGGVQYTAMNVFAGRPIFRRVK